MRRDSSVYTAGSNDLRQPLWLPSCCRHRLRRRCGVVRHCGAGCAVRCCWAFCSARVAADFSDPMRPASIFTGDDVRPASAVSRARGYCRMLAAQQDDTRHCSKLPPNRMIFSQPSKESAWLCRCEALLPSCCSCRLTLQRRPFCEHEFRAHGRGCSPSLPHLGTGQRPTGAAPVAAAAPPASPARCSCPGAHGWSAALSILEQLQCTQPHH